VLVEEQTAIQPTHVLAAYKAQLRRKRKTVAVVLVIFLVAASLFAIFLIKVVVHTHSAPAASFVTSTPTRRHE